MTPAVNGSARRCTRCTARGRVLGIVTLAARAAVRRNFWSEHRAHRQPEERSLDGQRERRADRSAPPRGASMDKGLKNNAIGYISNIVIGVASTAPAYSLAATLGFIVADPGVATHAPAVLLAAFVPMLLDLARLPLPEQGRPRRGHNLRLDHARLRAGLRLAQRLGDLPRRRAGDGLARLHRRDLHLQALRMALGGNPQRRGARRGILWILLMTWICHRGIELSARIQQLLLSFEVVMLGDLRGGRARRGLRRQPPPRTRSSRRPSGSTRSR